MPVIPDYRDRAELRVQNPTPIAGSQDERLIGESIAGLGEGMQRFGSALAEFNSAARRAKAQRDKEKYGEDAETSHFALSEEARSRSNPDGTDVIPNYLSASKKWEEERAATITDANSREIFQLATAKARNARLADLYGTARAMQIQTNENAANETVNKIAALAMIDPARAPVYAQQVRDSISARVANGSLRADQAAKVDEATGRIVGDAAITGLINQRNWDQAKKELVTTFASAYDSESRTKQFDRIDRAEQGFYASKYKEEKRQREEDKRLHEERQEANRAMVTERFRAAKNPAQRLEAMSLAESLRASDYLSKTDFSEILARQNARREETSTTRYQNLRSQVELGKMGRVTLRKAVTAAWNSGDLTETDGDKLFNLADQMEREAKQGVSTSQQVTQINKMIDTLTMPDGPQGLALKAMGITDPAGLRLQMKDKFMQERMKRNGVSPYLIGKEIIKDQFPAERTKRLIPVVQGLPAEKQDDAGWLNTEGKKALIRLYKQRKLDEPSFKKHMKTLENRVEVLPTLEN